MPNPAKLTTYRGLRKTTVSVFRETVSIRRPRLSCDERVYDEEVS